MANTYFFPLLPFSLESLKERRGAWGKLVEASQGPLWKEAIHYGNNLTLPQPVSDTGAPVFLYPPNTPFPHLANKQSIILQNLRPQPTTLLIQNAFKLERPVQHNLFILGITLYNVHYLKRNDKRQSTKNIYRMIRGRL